MKTERRAIGAVGSPTHPMKHGTTGNKAGAAADSAGAVAVRIRRARVLWCGLALLSVFSIAGPLLAADEAGDETAGESAPVEGRRSPVPEAADAGPVPGPAEPPTANALKPARVLPAAPSGPPGSGPESVPPGMAVDFPVDI